ncbi:MAG TPA: hypothetical protein VFS20_15580 [Longimicrobium sp.]|nr:hypothetical protein [Longimicrobium sp.]
MRIIRPMTGLAAALLLSACGFSVGAVPQTRLRSTAQEVFWQRLTHLCGRAYEGRMVEGTDSVFVRNRLVMHVRDCGADEVRIGFAIGPDPSRAWTVRKVAGGLALSHDVRGEQVTGYGGATRTAGTAERQEFAADTFTARILPPAAQNVWSLEIDPGRTFIYGVGRPGVQRRFRLSFDLRHAVPAPAPE